MKTPSIHDEILGEIVENQRRDVWIATLLVRRGQSIEIRIIDLKKALKVAHQLVPWIRDHEQQARQYAAEHLLDLHNDACIEGKPMTKAAFVKRLRLDSAAISVQGCSLCFKDRLQGWEHTVVVFVSNKQQFVRADTAPLVKRHESKLTLEPFPPLVLINGDWTGKIRLRHWRGFQARLGLYGSESAGKASDGTVQLEVPSSGKNRKGPPSVMQTEAFRDLLEHEEEIRNRVLDAILNSYPSLQKKYGYSKDETRELMPDLRSTADLKKLIGLSTVHVLTTSKNKIAYLGFEFGCRWDLEHGLGVMTHTNRVIEVGAAETAFLDWIAKNDSKR